MNTISDCTVDYITASRTIETLSFKNSSKFLYVYNYEGTHFRVFTEVLELVRFFQFGIEPQQTFVSESELDNFIINSNLD
jgi:hypothetical protein